MAQTVSIIGAGFAGLAAVRALAPVACRAEVTVRLFDTRPYTTMVPALADCAGGRYEGGYLTEDISRLLPAGVAFHQEHVDAVDLEDQTLTTARTTYAWDYLVLAAGAVTDFHGFDQHLEDVHKLDSLDDARRMRQAFATYADGAEQPHAVVVGGGYTGMQLACNLKYAGRECTPRPKITVVELKDHILPFMPAWVRDYMCRRAGQHGIELRPGLSVAEFDGRDVHLSDGTLLKHVFLAWAAGTTRTITRLRGNHEQLDDGRLVVDDCLRVPEHEGAFVAGDCAAIRSHGSYLRKAVNFSLGSGRCAGGNIANALRGRRPSTFRPVDLGWVIPFCDVGVGEVLSKYRVRGRVPLSLYCAMCGLRNYNWKNRLYFWRKALRALH